MIKQLNLKKIIKYIVFDTKALSSKPRFENRRHKAFAPIANTGCGSDFYNPILTTKIKKKRIKLVSEREPKNSIEFF